MMIVILAIRLAERLRQHLQQRAVVLAPTDSVLESERKTP
jgi:hypothetical protein